MDDTEPGSEGISPKNTPPAIRDGHRNLQFRDVQTDKKSAMLIHGSSKLRLGSASATPKQPSISACQCLQSKSLGEVNQMRSGLRGFRGVQIAAE